MTNQTHATTQRFSFDYAGRSDDRVIQFNVRESLDDLHAWTVLIATESAHLDFNEIRLKSAQLSLHDPNGQVLRRFSGVVTGIRYHGQTRRYRQYQLTLDSVFGLLKYRKTQRIYQEQDAQAIIQDVIKQAGIPSNQVEFNLVGKPLSRVYCVQYQETDWQFIQRLCQEEGWYHWLNHDDHKQILQIANHREAHVLLAPKTISYHAPGSLVATAESGTREAHIHNFQPEHAIGYERVTLKDFAYLKPTLKLESEAKLETPGRDVVRYPGRLIEAETGERRAKQILEAEQAQRHRQIAESDHPMLQPGREFELNQYPDSRVNGSYMIAEVTHFGEQPQATAEDATSQPTRYHNNFFCVRADQPYRNRITSNKPKIAGYQTAKVIGPDGEKLYTDEHGRIKVRFHWDNSEQTNERNSCWMRVTQAWAGSAYGSFVLPRIGQEVVVQFENGDADRPMVTGAVYNGMNRAPLDLPTQKTQTVLRTKLIGEEGYHEIRIEDQAEKAAIAIESGKDWTRYVKHDSKTFIGNEHHLVIKKDQIEQVEGDKHQTIKGDGAIKGEGALTIGITADLQLKAGNDIAWETSGELHLKSGSKVVIEAATEATVKVGGSFLKIDSGGVTVVGSQIKLNSGGSAGSGKGVSLLSNKYPVEVQKAESANEAQWEPPQIESPPAKVLAIAAQNGSAFCEKCEKAKQGKAESTKTKEISKASSPNQRTNETSSKDDSEYTIQFGPNADSSLVSSLSLTILRDVMKKSGVKKVKITSTARDSKSQARIMYDNIMQNGVESQKRLYGSAGDLVIDVYIKEKKHGKNKDQIIESMRKRIDELGPSTVSAHSTDSKTLNVFDIAPSSIPGDKKSKFIREVKKESRISKFLQPPDDPAYHLEILQSG